MRALRHQPQGLKRPQIGLPGLTGLFTPHNASLANSVSGRAASLLGVGSGSPSVLTKQGFALAQNIFGGAGVITTATLESGTTELITGTDATFVWFGNCVNLTFGGMMCRGDDASGNGSNLRMGITSGGEAQFSYVDTSPAGFTATTSGATIAVNEFVCIVGVKRGTSITVYCKGKSASSSGGNGNLRTSGRGVSLGFFSNSSVTTGGGAGNHVMAATFNRAIDADLAKQITKNPWLLFRAPENFDDETDAAVADTALSASLSSQSGVSASLGTGIAMAASLQAGASASANLTTSIPLAASLSAAASVTAGLFTSIPLTVAAGAQASLSASLSTQKPLVASMSAQASLTAQFDGGAAQLACAMACSSSVSASLTTAKPLVGSFSALATLAGQLSTEIRLSAALAASSTLYAEFPSEAGETPMPNTGESARTVSRSAPRFDASGRRYLTARGTARNFTTH